MERSKVRSHTFFLWLLHLNLSDAMGLEAELVSREQPISRLALFRSSSVTMRQMAFIVGRAAWLKAVFHFQ